MWPLGNVYKKNKYEMTKEHEHIRSPPSQYHSATLNLKYLVLQESTCDFFEIYTKTQEKN